MVVVGCRHCIHSGYRARNNSRNVASGGRTGWEFSTSLSFGPWVTWRRGRGSASAADFERRSKPCRSGVGVVPWSTQAQTWCRFCRTTSQLSWNLDSSTTASFLPLNRRPQAISFQLSEHVSSQDWCRTPTFSVWRPHGARLFRTLKFQAHYYLAPSSGWRTREIAGPTSYEEWRSSWDVFAFAVEVLQAAASRARLQRYAGHIRVLADRCHGRLQCRTEHLERVRRVSVVEHAAGRLPDFEPARPWDVVFLEVTNDHAFWADKQACIDVRKKNCE